MAISSARGAVVVADAAAAVVDTVFEEDPATMVVNVICFFGVKNQPEAGKDESRFNGNSDLMAEISR